MSATRFGSSRRLLALLRRRRRGRSALFGWLSAVVAALCIGLVASPATIQPLRAGSVVHWGGWPLETAFAALVLACAVVTFRVQEMFYRSHDAAALRSLPVSPFAFALDRLQVAFVEGLAVAAVVAALVAPSFARPGGSLAWAALAFVCVGCVVVPLVGFASIGLAGASAASARGPGAPPASVSAAFHFAPGVAFGVCAAALLIAKLGIEEPLRAASSGGAVTVTRAALVGVGIPLAVALVGAAVAVSRVRGAHDEMQGLFVDADSHSVDPGYQHFGGERERASWLEGRLDAEVGLLYRKDRLQLARSTPFLRVGTWIAAVVAVFVGWASGGNVSPELAGLALGGWLALVIAPASRLARLPGEVRYGLADMLAEPRARLTARRVAATGEAWRHALPLSLAAVGFGVDGSQTVVGVVLASVAAVVVTSLGPASAVGRVAAFMVLTGSVVIAPGGTLSAILGASTAVVFTAAALTSATARRSPA